MNLSAIFVVTHTNQQTTVPPPMWARIINLQIPFEMIDEDYIIDLTAGGQFCPNTDTKLPYQAEWESGKRRKKL